MPRLLSHPRLYEQARQARRRAQLVNRAEGFALLLVLALAALILSSCSTARPAGVRAGRFAQERAEPRTAQKSDTPRLLPGAGCQKQCSQRNPAKIMVSTEITTSKKSKAELAEQISFTSEQVQLMKDTVAKGATDNEFLLFMHLAKTYGLDPFAKEIWCLKYGSNQPATIFTSRDGYLKIASRDAHMDGIQSDVVYANDVLEKLPDGTVKHSYGRPDRGGIIGAYALVFRKDRSRPAYFFAPMSEYSTGNNPTWKKYPSAMIVKVAEAMALKRAFSISGLVTQEEIGLDAYPDAEAGTGAEVVAEAPRPAPAAAPSRPAGGPDHEKDAMPSDEPTATPPTEAQRKQLLALIASPLLDEEERRNLLSVPVDSRPLDWLKKTLSKLPAVLKERQDPKKALAAAQNQLRTAAARYAAQLGEQEHKRWMLRADSLTAKPDELRAEARALVAHFTLATA